MAEVTVTGVVASVNGTGSGFTILETVNSPTQPGKTWSRYWRCWMPKVASYAVPSKDDTLTVVGTWGGRVDEKNARYVDHILNDVRVDRSVHEPVQESRTYPDSEQPPEDPWGPVAQIPDGETPF